MAKSVASTERRRHDDSKSMTLNDLLIKVGGWFLSGDWLDYLQNYSLFSVFANTHSWCRICSERRLLVIVHLPMMECNKFWKAHERW